jgi:pyruvate dehydrogenase E1 component
MQASCESVTCSLAADGKTTAKDVAQAIKLYKIDSEKLNPVAV